MVKIPLQEPALLWSEKLSSAAIYISKPLVKYCAADCYVSDIDELGKYCALGRSDKQDLMTQNSSILNRTVLVIRSDLVCSNFVQRAPGLV